MGKKYIEYDVLTMTNARLHNIFTNGRVCVSVSGGKDSSVMCQLCNKWAGLTGSKFDVMYIDLEAQYYHTIDHINELKKLENIGTFYHIALPMYLRNAVSVLQPKWICWNKADKHLWVRSLPEDAITEDNCTLPFYNGVCEFEEFVPKFNAWWASQSDETAFIGVGIRSDESLNRFRTIVNHSKETWDGKSWTTKIGENMYNFYPLYDWRTEDIWGAISQLDLSFNYIYELMYKNGVPISEQRLCQPYGDDQRQGLDQFRVLEAETWEKVLDRVNGVNFGNIYCKTSALGNLNSTKPDFMSWQEYTVYLLESIGLYNKDLMLHYTEKIRKFIQWYEKEQDMTLDNAPDAADLHAEANHKVFLWRRIARAIERNDFYMKRLSFSQTKSDEEKLRAMIRKWDNLLSPETESTDKDIRRLKNEIYQNESIRGSAGADSKTGSEQLEPKQSSKTGDGATEAKYTGEWVLFPDFNDL